MFFKSLQIVLYTGLSNILSFLVITYLVKNNASDSFIQDLAYFDSALSFILACLSFGYLQVVSRDIVLKKDWQNILYKSQSARISLAILIIVLGVLFSIIKNEFYFVLLISPFIALNPLFALYSRGKPLVAARLSFFKVLIPVFFLFLISFFEWYYIEIYLIAQVVAFTFAGYFSSKALDIEYFIRPIAEDLKEYIKNIEMGFVDISISILQMGILVIAGFIYNASIIGNTFLVLKLYILFKGVLRIVFQTFYHRLSDTDIIILSEKISAYLGICFFCTLFFYSNELILFLFTQDFLEHSILLKIIGLSGLVVSCGITSTTSLLLFNRDKSLIKSYLFSMIFLILSLFGFHYFDKEYGVVMSLLVGEIILIITTFYYLKDKISFMERIQNIVPLIVLIIVVFFIQSNVENILLSIVIVCLILVFRGLGLYFSNKRLLDKVNLITD